MLPYQISLEEKVTEEVTYLAVHFARLKGEDELVPLRIHLKTHYNAVGTEVLSWF